MSPLPRPRAWPALLATTTALALVAGCGGGTEDRADGGTLDVLAAASLTEPFTALAERFEQERPGLDVRLVFDSSAVLAEQVNQGAPADVVATADERTMQLVARTGRVDGVPEVFATNTLVLVTPADDPGDVGALEDLDRRGVQYVVCVPSAPCGALARTVLDASGVDASPASEEIDVKAVLSKVVLGEADAGFVYASDAVAAGDTVRATEIAALGDAVNRYLLATVADADDPEAARAWVDLVLSDEGQAVLADAGFGPP